MHTRLHQEVKLFLQVSAKELILKSSLPEFIVYEIEKVFK